MSAMTSQERTKKHRLKKAVKYFSSAYMGKELLVSTPKDFIEGKLNELNINYCINGSAFKISLTNSFYEILTDYKSVDGLFCITDMLEAWKSAERINKLLSGSI